MYLKFSFYANQNYNGRAGALTSDLGYKYHVPYHCAKHVVCTKDWCVDIFRVSGGRFELKVILFKFMFVYIHYVAKSIMKIL